MLPTAGQPSYQLTSMGKEHMEAIQSFTYLGSEAQVGIFSHLVLAGI